LLPKQGEQKPVSSDAHVPRAIGFQRFERDEGLLEASGGDFGLAEGEGNFRELELGASGFLGEFRRFFVLGDEGLVVAFEAFEAGFPTIERR
jgi:hypothetical protein